LRLCLIVSHCLLVTHVGDETSERREKEFLDAFAPDFVQVPHHLSASLQDLEDLVLHSQGFLEVMILDKLLVDVCMVPVPEEFGKRLMLLLRL
jgi:hypothetical protein